MARTPTRGLSVERMRELARAGAHVTLKRLQAEIIAIERTFPEQALLSCAARATIGSYFLYNCNTSGYGTGAGAR